MAAVWRALVRLWRIVASPLAEKKVGDELDGKMTQTRTPMLTHTRLLFFWRDDPLGAGLFVRGSTPSGSVGG